MSDCSILQGRSARMGSPSNAVFVLMEDDERVRQRLVTSSSDGRPRVTSVTRSQYHDDLKADMQTVRDLELDLELNRSPERSRNMRFGRVFFRS